MELKMVIIILVVISLFTIILFHQTFNSAKTDYVCNDCNLLVISIDSLRSDHLGVYGYERNVSPNIDALASQSFVFENHIAQTYLTPVSEYSMQTSLYPHQHGLAVPNLYGQQFSLQNPPTTLAQILKAYNYTTISVLSSPEFYYYKEFSNGFDIVNATNPTKRSLPTFDSNLWNILKKDKFFLWLAIGTVHAPYGAIVPQEIQNKYINPNYHGFFENKNLTLNEILSIYNSTYYPTYYVPSIDDYVRNYSAKPISLNQDDMNFIIGKYDSGIDYTDQYIGNLINTLKGLGILNKTIIVLTSAHGEEFGEHGIVMHYDIYEPEIHVPLIIWDPHLLEHEVIKPQTQQIDVLPTILDLLKIPPYEKAEGHSLVPLILNKSDPNFDKYVFIERYPLWEEFVAGNGTVPLHADFAIRTNEWKLIYRASKSFEMKNSWYVNLTGSNISLPDFELYNIKDDPLEQRNLYFVRSDIAQQLNVTLQNWLKTVNVDQFFNRTATHPTELYPYP